MSLYKKLLKDFISMYMAYIPLGIILQSCIGSIATLLILINNSFEIHSYLQLTLCVIVTMLFNAAVLAQLQYKITFNLLLLSLTVNSLLIAINLAILI
jgi:hypothetical protein